MNSFDRRIKKKRTKQYKYLKKLFKARDRASKYVHYIIKIKWLDEIWSNYEISSYTVNDLAEWIVKADEKVIKKHGKDIDGWKSKEWYMQSKLYFKRRGVNNEI